MDKLKDELVKTVSDKIEESTVENTFEAKQEIEIREPKVYTVEEFREREILIRSIGLMARWLKCSGYYFSKIEQHFSHHAIIPNNLFQTCWDTLYLQ